MHVIREDPANKNLLFAGTEFGIFVSFDRGANWHRMKNGLPTVPVFDIQIHPRDHDLILATHGRSIWIMDNIRSLEALNDQVLTSDLKLFDARPGIEWKMANYRGFEGTSNFFASNAPTGVVLDYWAKTGGPVRVTVTDKSGKQVRQENTRAVAGTINRTIWDMRYDSPIPPAAGGGRGGRGGGGRGGRGAAAGTAAGEIANEFGAPGAAEAGRGGGGGGGGGGRFGGAGRGSLVDPGEYTVSLTLAGKTETQKVTVEDDPRIQMSDEVRARRRKAIDTLVSMTKEADGGRRKAVAMTTALTNLTNGWKTPNAAPVPEAVKTAAEDLLKRVKTAAAIFENQNAGGRGGSAGPPPPYSPPPVTQKIARLMQGIDNYSEAPTSRQMSDIDVASAELQKGLAAINTLWDEVPKFNKMMSDAGVQYFKVDLNSVPAATFGGRGQ